MQTDGAVPVEEFIGAFAAQLDRFQDLMRLKAENRPVTFALKELEMDLQAFMQVDPQGRVQMRPAGANETGASTLHLTFTTITAPMIEENTVSLAVSRSPSLTEAGVSADERARLERIGVHNLAQLRHLGSSTGLRGVSRYAELSPERIGALLSASQPRVDVIRIEPRPGKTGNGAPPTGPRETVVFPPRTAPVTARPPLVAPVSAVPPARSPVSPVTNAPEHTGDEPPMLRVPAGTPRLRLVGRNLLGEEGPARIRLNDQPLQLSAADEHELVVELPSGQSSDEPALSGTLEIELPGGRIERWSLEATSPEATDEWDPRMPEA